MYRIAVIDDNETWCFVMATALQQRGYLVATFSDAYAFLRQASQFDMVLVDFSLPPRRYQKELSGPDVIRHLHKEFAKPPLTILISAYFTHDILTNVPEICPEADACLSKGTPLEKLLQQIEQVMLSRGDRRAMLSSNSLSNSSSHSASNRVSSEVSA